jgi:hypothetical protein
MKQNYKRWLVELGLMILAMMVLDGGFFAITAAAASAFLEGGLLLLSLFKTPASALEVFGRPWVPVVAWMACLAGHTLVVN